jgi:hypothetical protein
VLEGVGFDFGCVRPQSFFRAAAATKAKPKKHRKMAGATMGGGGQADASPMLNNVVDHCEVTLLMLIILLHTIQLLNYKNLPIFTINIIPHYFVPIHPSKNYLVTFFFSTTEEMLCQLRKVFFDCCNGNYGRFKFKLRQRQRFKKLWRNF